jgi:hypothetical protein
MSGTAGPAQRRSTDILPITALALKFSMLFDSPINLRAKFNNLKSSSFLTEYSTCPPSVGKLSKSLSFLVLTNKPYPNPVPGPMTTLTQLSPS